MLNKILGLSWLILFSGALHAADSSNSYYEDASKLFFEKDYKGALIQLKNALQMDTEHVPSLLLAGQTHLRLNQPAVAEEFLIKARVLGADHSFVNVKLAEAYLEQAKYRSIVEEFATDDLPPSELVTLLGYVAQAWLGLGNEAEAGAAIAQANQIDPDALRPGIAQVLLQIKLGKKDQAIVTAERLTQHHPMEAVSWNSYASALHAVGKLKSALVNYSKAIELDKNQLNARIARVGLWLDLGDYSKALSDLDYLNVHYPYEPRAAYFRGMVYSRLASPDNDYAEQSLLEFKKCTEVIAQLPPRKVTADTQLTMSAALAHFSLGKFEASKEYLDKYLQKMPRDPGANRLMGSILIKLDDPFAAIKVLKPLQQQFRNDPEVTSLLAAAYSLAGQYDTATELLESLQDSGRGNSETDVRLALSLLQSGSAAAGIEKLDALFADGNQLQPGFALVIAQLKNNLNKDALANAQRLVERAPENDAFKNILGVALQANNEFEQARLVFKSLLQSNAGFLPAHINLAKTEESLGNTDIARQQLTELLLKYPNSSKLTLALAQLERRQSNKIDALKLAERAKQLSPKDLDIRTFLVELYLETGDFETAETLAIDTALTNDNNFESTTILAQVYTHTGKPRKAISLYKRMTKEAGFNTENLYKIATLLVQNQAWKAARHALFKAIEGNPQHTPSQREYIKIQLQLREYEDAMKRSLVLLEIAPKDIRGHILAGDSSMGLQQFARAELLFRQGLEIDTHPQLVVGLYRSMMAQDKTVPAGELLAQYWEPEKPNELLGGAYAEHLIGRGEWQPASEVIVQLINAYPGSAGLLNNLAYVLDKLGDPAALSHAREAHRLAPDNPFINDTLGWLLTNSGQPEDALKFLRQAQARLSENPEIRYHLGKTLLLLGRHAEAAAELKAALKSGLEFEGRLDAERLLEGVTNPG